MSPLMLTVTNPEVVDTLVDFPRGLWPIRRRGDSRMILVVKAQREMAQTAKLRGGFRFYLVPVRVGAVATYGLLTAFFDDNDEPLVIRTPLFNEEITRDSFCCSRQTPFTSTSSTSVIENCLVSELRTRMLIASARSRTRFASCPQPLITRRQFLDEMQFWFSARSLLDDSAAFTIHLRERLFPDSLAEYVDNPGDLNEPDIATALHRPFGGDHVFTNPIRADKRTRIRRRSRGNDQDLLLIQAKDSPNAASTLNRSIDRKKATAKAHIRKAAAQLRGSINHLRSGSSIGIITDGQRCDVSMSGWQVFGLVIVKELFDPELPACSPLVSAVLKSRAFLVYCWTIRSSNS